MRKRIRVHEARIGMFVDEIEHCSPKARTSSSKFLILGGEELREIHNSRALSLLIDTDKGADIELDSRYSSVEKRECERLLRSCSPEELVEAQRTLAETIPLVRNLVTEARMTGVISLENARLAADQVILAARDNATALIAVSRLKSTDQTTYLHSLAVSALLTCFSRHLGFDERTVRDFALGGLLHDIGKTVLPINVLAKTGALSTAEYALIRTHPRQGYELLQKIEGMPAAVLDMCLHHHEHYDGRGYPDRLTGDEIQLSTRIAAICDVYEAMTTIRPYKQAWSQREAIEMMQASKGHFDPELLSLFLSSFHRTSEP